MRLLERPQRRDPGQEVPEAEVTQDGYGQEGFPAGVTISSRTSTYGGRVSAETTVSAPSGGSLRRWSGPGLNASSRPSKKCVAIPPGTSIVTPTRSPSSSASARVKPTTPNLLAQYAVAA